MMNPHEQAFVEAFVQKSRRERALLCLADPKRRRKLTDRFAHHGTDILAPECLRSIVPSQQHPKNIYSLLRGLGAPEDCHVISENSDLDGKEMGLLPALEEVVGNGMGTVISCVPGRLAYFEGELRERYILQK
ncbi:MAG: hypothetical protein ACLPXM_20855 [Terriglobales bacterium]